MWEDLMTVGWPHPDDRPNEGYDDSPSRSFIRSDDAISVNKQTDQQLLLIRGYQPLYDRYLWINHHLATGGHPEQDICFHSQRMLSSRSSYEENEKLKLIVWLRACKLKGYLAWQPTSAYVVHCWKL